MKSSPNPDGRRTSTHDSATRSSTGLITASIILAAGELVQHKLHNLTYSIVSSNVATHGLLTISIGGIVFINKLISVDGGSQVDSIDLAGLSSDSDEAVGVSLAVFCTDDGTAKLSLIHS